MALLQIAEPGESTAPHEHRLAAGIDLGTTNSLVASVRSGQPETLADADTQAAIAGAVAYLLAGVVNWANGPGAVFAALAGMNAAGAALLVLSPRQRAGGAAASSTVPAARSIDNSHPSSTPHNRS